MKRFYAIVQGFLAVPLEQVSNEEMDDIQKTIRLLGPMAAIPCLFSEDGRLYPHPANYVIITQEVEIKDGRATNIKAAV